MKLHLFISLLIAWLACPFAFSQQIEFTKIGDVAARHAQDIVASKWSVGAETMDRDYTIYANWKKYLGPLGIKKTRIQGGWAKTEQEKGIYNWAWLDEIIYDMVDQGVEPWVCLCYGNPLYAGGGEIRLGAKMPVSDEAMAGWKNWVSAFVQRYKEVIYEWEVWNEPHLRGANSTEIYGNLYIETAQIIRAIQPDATIIALAMAGARADKAESFLQFIASKKKLHLIDKITYHPYKSNPDQSYHAVAEIQAVINRYSSTITLFQGENGCPSEFRKSKALSGYDWTELSQAKWALRRMLGDLGRDIPSSYFAICDMKYPDEINRKGLLEINNNKEVIAVKPAYYALQHLASIFDHTLQRVSHYPYKVQSDLALSLFAYENRATQKQVITIWEQSDIPSDKNATTKLDFIFPMGNFSNPLYVDVRTGDVYKIPKENWSKAGTEYTFRDIPIYDSPILIIDASNLHWND